MAEVTVGFPIQETSSEGDSGHFPPLSKEETPNHSLSQGPKPKGNNSTSMETFKGEHITINKTQETNKDFTLNGDCFIEAGHKGDVASKPNDNIRGHHGGIDSNSRADDCANIDIYTAATSSKLQGEGDMAKNNTIELENKTYTDLGRNNGDSSCFRPTTEETDVNEGNGKAFDVKSPTVKSSTGLEQHSIVIQVIRQGNSPTPVLKSKDCARANSEENNLTLESHRSDNSATKVFESGHNGDVDCQNNCEIFAHHDVTSSISGGGQTGGDASNSRIDDGIPCCTLQDGANTAKMTTDNGGGNNDYLYYGPNINETDFKERRNKSLDGNIPNNGSSTGCEQDINVIREDNQTNVYYNLILSKSEDSSTVSPDINNTATKTFESGHHLDVGYRPDQIFGHHEVKYNFSATSQTGGNVSRIDDNMDINTCNTSKCFKQQGGAKMDKNNPIDSEIKTDQGADNNTLSCHESNIKETDVKEVKSETCNGSCLNDKSSTGLQHNNNVPEVTRPYDDTAMIMESGDGSTTGSEENNLVLEGDRSSTCADKICESEDNGDESCRHNGEIFAYRKVNPSLSKASQTGENASSFRIYGGTHIDVHCTATCCKAELDQNNGIDLENNIPRDYGGGNIDLSYCRQTINDPDIRYDNSSADPLQDPTEVIKSDDQTTVIPNLDNSDTEDCEKNNPTLVQNGLDSTTKVFGSEPNGDVECRPNDGACQIGGKTSTDLRPGIFRINDGTNTDTYKRGRRKDGKPDDKIFSSHRRDNNDLSRQRPKSQHQSRDSLTPANSTDVQPDGTDSAITSTGDHVSLGCRSLIFNPLETKTYKQNPSKPSSGVYKPWNVFWTTLLCTCIFWMMTAIAGAAPVQGLQHNNNVPEVTRPYDDTAMIMESGDGSTTGSEENNLVLEGDRSSTCADKICESEDNGDESCRHNGEIFAYRKVNPSLSKASQTGENASSFRIYGGTHIDVHCTATCCKAELDQNNGIDLENNIPRDYGGGNIDLSYCRQTINDPDIRYDNSSADPLQDPTEVIKSDDQTTVIPNLDNSDTEDCEKNNPTLVQNGLDSTTKVFGSEPNGDVECRPNDGACQIGGKTSTDLRPGIFRINDGTNTDTYKRGRRKDGKPDDKIFSSHRRDNNDLSRQRPKSQHQSRDSLTPANSTDVQPDGTDSAITSTGDHVSLGCRSLIFNPLETKTYKQNPSKPSSGVYKPWNVFWTTLLCTCIFWMMTAIAGAAPVQDFQVPPQMRSYHFCADESLIGQVPAIRHMDDPTAVNCTINFTSAGFFRNCLESGCLIFGKNETCVEMLTTNLNTTDYHMEYTITRNGDRPKAHSVLGAPGDLLSAAEVMAKITEYTKPVINTTPAPLYGHNNTTPAQQKEDNNSQTVGIVVGVLVAAGLVVTVLGLLWKNWSKLKSWVNSHRRHNPDRASNTDNHECDIPLREMPNGHVNGRVPNEETQ